MFLHEVPCGAAGGTGIGHGEGQLKHLGLGKTASRVTGHGPDHVGHTVFGLVIQLRWGAAQLHGREDLALQAVVGVFGDVFAPVAQHGGVLNGLWSQKVVHLQGDGLGVDAKTNGHQACGQGRLLQEFLHRLVSNLG